MNKPSLRQAGSKLFTAESRQRVSTGPEALVRFSTLLPDSALPELAQPVHDDVDLAGFLAAHRQHLETRLVQHGAMLFRDFPLKEAQDLQRCLTAYCGDVMDYSYRATKRTLINEGVYTSTDHPSTFPLGLHNEVSYARSWPLKIAFLSLVVAAEGGQTPLADSRRIHDDIPEGIRRAFARHGLMYVYNYGHATHLSWQEAFQTAERNEVSRICRQKGMDYEWKADGKLHARMHCQSIAQHPQTGERVWFNQAHLTHSSCYQPGLREEVFSGVAEEDLPVNVFFGDGAPIPAEMLQEIRRVYDTHTVQFDWQRGDLLLIDNMLVAHGRQPFTGSRRVVVAMAAPYDNPDYEATR